VPGNEAGSITLGHETQANTAHAAEPGDASLLADPSQPCTHVKRTDVFDYAAGQWVDMFIPGVPVVGGFSIVSAPDLPPALAAAVDCPQLPYFDLAIKVGRHPPAAWVHASAKQGDAVAVRVGGRFTLESVHVTDAATGQPRYAHIVLVAGGVGVNPLYSMLLSLAGRIEAQQLENGQATARGGGSAAISARPPPASGGGPTRHGTGGTKCEPQGVLPQPTRATVTLLYSCRSADELLFMDHIRALGGPGGLLHGHLRVHATVTRDARGGAAAGALSREESGRDPWSPHTLHRGRITPELLAATLADFPPGTSAVVLCGPPAMTDAVVGACRGLGVADDDLHYEKWW
jgi:ferredoxin-NADP reductase